VKTNKNTNIFGKDRRFERLARLIDVDGMKKLHDAHVMVVGLGGVGSWCAEALIRSGVGRLTIVDFDKVSVSNFNRQMPGIASALGKSKAESMALRLREINERCDLRVKNEAVNRYDLSSIFDDHYDYVIDAIDQLGNKCALISYCVRHDIPVVTSAGAGGRLDPTRVKVIDLSETLDDPLARMVRVYLRKRHLFPRKGLFYVPCVVSDEPVRHPVDPAFGPDAIDVTPVEFSRIDPPSPSKRNLVMGTASFVTSMFGMTCASVVVRTLLGERIHGVKKKPKSFKLPPEPPMLVHEGGKNSADD
jgi:tRNA A37 threonylcarbamoyladenosine dehydratase